MSILPRNPNTETLVKQFLLAVLSYFVLTMLWAYPWHLLWLHDLYLELGAMTRDPPIIPFGMAAIVIQGIKPEQKTIIDWLVHAYPLKNHLNGERT